MYSIIKNYLKKTIRKLNFFNSIIIKNKKNKINEDSWFYGEKNKKKEID